MASVSNTPSSASAQSDVQISTADSRPQMSEQDYILSQLRRIFNKDLSEQASIEKASKRIYKVAKDDIDLSSSIYSLGAKVQMATEMVFNGSLTEKQYRRFISKTYKAVKNEEILPNLDFELEASCKEGDVEDLLEIFEYYDPGTNGYNMIRAAISAKIQDRFDEQNLTLTSDELGHLFTFLEDFPSMTKEHLNAILEIFLFNFQVNSIHQLFLQFRDCAEDKYEDRYVYNGMEILLSLPALYKFPDVVREFRFECEQYKWKFSDETAVIDHIRKN